MEKKINIHSGHRKRIKDRFIENGLNDFEPHNVLELLLFFAVPRKDTNEIAHLLINEFGSLENVFDASFDELKALDGLGENAATLISLIPEIAKIYYQSKISMPQKAYDYKSIGDLLVSKFLFATNECVIGLFFDNASELIYSKMLCEGGINSTYLSFRTIAQIALNKKASSFVIAHNHPKGLPIPSVDDIDTTKLLLNFVNNLGIKFLEHYVVAGNRYSGIFHDCGITL